MNIEIFFSNSIVLHIFFNKKKREREREREVFRAAQKDCLNDPLKKD